MNEYGTVLENVDLKKYNSYGIGGKTRFLIKVYPDKIKELIQYLNKEHIKWYILGNGTNVILPDEDFNGVILKLDYFNKLEITNDILTVGAGLNLSYVLKKVFSQGYTNMVNLCGIPGTIGAAVIGNAGSFGSCIFDFLESVTILDEEQNIKTLKKTDIDYGYRYTEFKKQKNIILEVKLKLAQGDIQECTKIWQEHMAKRKATQPLGTKNAGSVFKNPKENSAGQLIEAGSPSKF